MVSNFGLVFIYYIMKETILILEKNHLYLWERLISKEMHQNKAVTVSLL